MFKKPMESKVEHSVIMVLLHLPTFLHCYKLPRSKMIDCFIEATTKKRSHQVRVEESRSFPYVERINRKLWLLCDDGGSLLRLLLLAAFLQQIRQTSRITFHRSHDVQGRAFEFKRDQNHSLSASPREFVLAFKFSNHGHREAHFTLHPPPFETNPQTRD